MTSVLYRKLLADCRLFLGVVCLLLLAFQVLWAYVASRISGDILKQFSERDIPVEFVRNTIFKGPGQTIQALMGGEVIRIEYAQDLVTIGYVHPLVLIVLSVWAIGRTSAAIAGEIDRGTMELLLAQPIRRSQVILAHLLVDLTTIPLICLCLWAGTWLGTWLVGLQSYDSGNSLYVDPRRFWPGLVNTSVFALAISGYTMLISAAGRSRSKVLGVAFVITLVQFLVNVIGQLWTAMDWLRPYTVFYHYQPQPMILHKQNWMTDRDVLLHLSVLLGVAVGGYLLAWWKFCTRDLPAPL